MPTDGHASPSCETRQAEGNLRFRIPTFAGMTYPSFFLYINKQEKSNEASTTLNRINRDRFPSSHEPAYPPTVGRTKCLGGSTSGRLDCIFDVSENAKADLSAGMQEPSTTTTPFLTLYPSLFTIHSSLFTIHHSLLLYLSA
jgi:hypothetical protein